MVPSHKPCSTPFRSSELRTRDVSWARSAISCTSTHFGLGMSRSVSSPPLSSLDSITLFMVPTRGLSRMRQRLSGGSRITVTMSRDNDELASPLVTPYIVSSLQVVLHSAADGFNALWQVAQRLILERTSTPRSLGELSRYTVGETFEDVVRQCRLLSRQM